MSKGEPARATDRGLVAIHEATGSIAGAVDAESRNVRVVLIRAGEAKSGRIFTPRALADIAAAADGLRCFADHPTALEDRLRPARSVRDIVGVFRAPRLVGAGGEPTQVEAALHVLEYADWLWQLVKEVVQLEERDVIGLSIDALCTLVTESRAGRTVQIVESVPVLKSCDVVTRASAGGEFLAIEESAAAGSRGRQRPDARTAGRLLLPAPETAHRNAANSRGGNEVNAQTAVADPGTPTERHVGHSAVREAAEQLACARILYDRLAAARLPEPVKQKLRRFFELPLEPESEGNGRPYWQTREAFASDLDSAIVQEIEALDALRQYDSAPAGGPLRGLVSGHGAARTEIMGHDGVSRGMVALQTAWDRLFGVRESEQARARLEQLGLAATSAVPRWTSLREAYVQTTGDSLVSGVYQPQLALVREANEVTTSTLSQVVLNSMTKRLVQDYAGQPQAWRRFCTLSSVRDFKAQDRVKTHDFASLATVSEGATYQNLSWDDRKESYTPAKRGNLVVVTRETILNDDLEAVRKIPTRLAVSAGITMNEYVYTTLITTNPTMADGKKVFDGGSQTSHANRGTSALSGASVQAGILAMLKQTNEANKRIGQHPRFLLVPPDLLFTAKIVVGSPLTPGGSNNDVNPLHNQLEVIAVPQFTDTNDWYLLTDPAVLPTIELGFVGGQETPELLLQDAPTDGQVFTNDQISFKVRWEFGGGWLDYRGAYIGEVA